MTQPRKPLPLFYEGDRAKVNVFGLHGSDRYGTVVKIGRKLIEVELRSTGRRIKLPATQIDVY